jgi:hypothetical protein
MVQMKDERVIMSDRRLQTSILSVSQLSRKTVLCLLPLLFWMGARSMLLSSSQQRGKQVLGMAKRESFYSCHSVGSVGSIWSISSSSEKGGRLTVRVVRIW